MGVYDIYGGLGVQLKVGPCELKKYKKGDNVPLPDGIYVGFEGFIVVYKGKLLIVLKTITNKYGELIIPSDILKNPLEKILEERFGKEIRKNKNINKKNLSG